MLDYAVKYPDPLDNKEVLITLLPINQSLTLVFSEGKMHCFGGKSAKAPDLHISATPTAFLAMILKEDKTKIQMTGDAVLGQALQQFLNYANIDWENIIQNALGESFSYPVISFLKKTHEKLSQIHQGKKNQIMDFLQEDTNCLPLSSEVKDFCDAVDELKLRVDRIEALLKSFIQ